MLISVRDWGGNLELFCSSQSASDKVSRQESNSSDYWLRHENSVITRFILYLSRIGLGVASS